MVAALVRIHVTLKGALADRLPRGQGEVEFGEPVTIDDVVGRLRLPGGHSKFVVNGTAVRAGATLADGDRLLVFPPMSGG